MWWLVKETGLEHLFDTSKVMRVKGSVSRWASSNDGGKNYDDYARWYIDLYFGGEEWIQFKSREHLCTADPIAMTGKVQTAMDYILTVLAKTSMEQGFVDGKDLHDCAIKAERRLTMHSPR